MSYFFLSSFYLWSLWTLVLADHWANTCYFLILNFKLYMIVFWFIVKIMVLRSLCIVKISSIIWSLEPLGEIFRLDSTEFFWFDSISFSLSCTLFKLCSSSYETKFCGEKITSLNDRIHWDIYHCRACSILIIGLDIGSLLMSCLIDFATWRGIYLFAIVYYCLYVATWYICPFILNV